MRSRAVNAATALLSLVAVVGACTQTTHDGSATRATGAALEPTEASGDVTCAKLGYSGVVVVHGIDVGPYTSADGAVSVSISNISSVFDWTSNAPISAVIVYSGSAGANVYVYDPAATSGTRLHPPVNLEQGQGKYWGIHGVELCYDLTTPSADAGSDTAAPSPVDTDDDAGTGGDEDGGSHGKTW